MPGRLEISPRTFVILLFTSIFAIAGVVAVAASSGGSRSPDLALAASPVPAAAGAYDDSYAPQPAASGGDLTSASAALAGDAAPPRSPLDAAPADSGAPSDGPTATPEPATATPEPPTATPEPPTPTAVPPAATPAVPTATAVPPAPTRAPLPPAAPVGLTAMEQDMFAQHNQQRAGAGIAPLQLDPTLESVARQRAQDMAARGYFSHTSPTGQTAFTLLDASGYRYSIAGENIARNNYPDSQSVSTAMTGFMNSAGHRENILEPRFTRVGIAVATGADGMKYFAVVFSS